MGEQPTEIERLDAANPGLRLAVDLMFDRHATLKMVAVMLKERYEAEVPERTIANYRERRYRPAKARIEYLQEKTLAIVEIAKRVSEGEIRDARIYEELDSLDPKTLLRARYDSARLDIERGKLAVAEKQAETERGLLELKVRELEQKQRQVQEDLEQAEQQVAAGGTLSAEAVRRIRERTFGLAGVGSGAAVPGVSEPVDR
jgi:hypothetical protein